MKAKVKRNNKYVFRVVLAVWMMMAVVLTAFMPDTVRAEASETEKAYAAVYDYDYYKSHNEDLQKEFGNERQSYVDHFVRCGMKEGRQGSEEFNLEVYKYNSADLCAAYKDNNAAYYKHYIKYGKAEGRNAKTKEHKKASTVYEGTDYAAVYNYEYYRKNNADLQKIFGEDSAKYLKHFVQYGMNEGRQGNDEFILYIYKSNYSDLEAAFKSNNAAYYKHYIKYGKAEGRNAKTLLQTKDLCAILYANGGYFTQENGLHTTILKRNASNLGVVTFGQEPDNEDPHLTFDGWYTNKECTGEKVSDFRLCITENVCYYAKWVKANVITFDANGGYVVNDPSKTKYLVKIAEGKKPWISFYEQKEIVKRSSWVFKNWSLDLEGKKQVYPYNMEVTSDVTLYAQWEEAYNITFDAGEGYFENGSHIMVVQAEKSKELDWRKFPLRAPVIDDTTRIFERWYTEKDGKGELAEPGVKLSSDITFYANWESAISVKYDANGGKIKNENGNLTDTKTIKCKINSEYIPYVDATREGHCFDGWYLDKECTKKYVSYNTKLSENITLYAKWQKGYNIVFDANGGYFANENPESEKVTRIEKEGITLNGIGLPVDPISKDNLTIFDGWYFEADCINKVDFSCNDKIIEDMTLYAKWVQAYVVTYNGNGVNFNPGINIWEEEYPVMAFAVKAGKKIGEMTITSLGYTFNGWYLDSECTKPVDFDKEITSDVTFYASWLENVDIMFDPNPGNMKITSTYNWRTVLKGSEVKPMEENNFFIDISGRHIIEGWYFDKEHTKKVGDSFVANESVWLYAKWKAVNVVTFDANGEKFFTEENAKHYSVESGNTISYSLTGKPESFLKIPESKIFKGWSLEKNSADVISSDQIGEYVINGDMTFYAVWGNKYAIVCDAMGGYFYDDTKKNTLVTYCTPGDTYIPYIKSPDINDDSKIFAGWYFDKEATQPFDRDNYTMTGDITLYAKWDEACVITYNANGGCWKMEQLVEQTRKVLKGTEFFYMYAPDSENDQKAFDGWYFDAECTQVVHYNYKITENITVYAGWKNVRTITFDANGGTIEGEKTVVQKCNEGTNLYHVDTPVHPDDHIMFVGWYFDAECKQPLEDIYGYVVTQDITFYAGWSVANVVTFDGNGGFIYGNKDMPQYQIKVEPGKPIFAEPYVENPDETKMFAGWYLEPECINCVEDIYNYIPERDTTFYAKWVLSYTVTFDGNGGFIYGEQDRTQDSMKVEAGKSIFGTPYVEHPDEHQVFGGWYLEPECINKVENLYDYVPTQDMVFYAKWYNNYNVTFYANGGFFDANENITQMQIVCKEGQALEVSPYVEIKDENKTFACWCFDAECTNELLDYYNYIPSSDITLYAKWVPVENLN